MKWIALWLLLSALSCQPTQEPIAPGEGIIGSWQYVERGYSPGDRYITEKIPLTPAQRIDFTAERTVRPVTMSDGSFQSARTYRIDSTLYGPRISLFDSAGKTVGTSMTVDIRNDTLRLSPSCFEGCHFAFVRLRN